MEVNILKFRIRESIDIKNIRNKNFLENHELSKLNEKIYFLQIDKIKILEKIKKEKLEYVLEIEFSHLKNYFFSNEKLKKYFIIFICKKILLSFMEIRATTNSFIESSQIDISFDFSFSNNKIDMFI